MKRLIYNQTLVLLAILIVVTLACGGLIGFILHPASNQSIQFDGRTIDLSKSSNAVIQSTSITSTWNDVIQYSSIVTVTIYLKP